MILHGDCVEEMKKMAAESIDAIVTDPPYGLRFMGIAFDTLGDGPAQQAWHQNWLREAFRVLKPEGQIKAFGGTRTFHRLSAAMEDVGFVDVSIESWCYSSGFPKSLDVSKALAKRKQTQEIHWKGWGTNLKPAWEAICVAQKPGKRSKSNEL